MPVMPACQLIRSLGSLSQTIRSPPHGSRGLPRQLWAPIFLSLRIAQHLAALATIASARYFPTLPTSRLTSWIKRLGASVRSEEHTSELQSRQYLVCRLLLAKKKR